MAVSSWGAGSEGAWPLLPCAYLRRISSPLHCESEVSPRFLDPSLSCGGRARGADTGCPLSLSWSECRPIDGCAPWPLCRCRVGLAHPIRDLYGSLRCLPHAVGPGLAVPKRGRDVPSYKRDNR